MAGLVSPTLDITIEAVNSDQNAFNNNGLGGAPPDSHGTVGLNHVVNVANQSIQWFTKAGVEQMNTSLTNFFRPLQPAGALGPFDPKIIYDHYSDRYFVVALEVLDTTSGDAINSSRILMAVSDDSDPNGSWYYQSVNSMLNINNTPQWLDYPGLGIDEQAIYITGNMFPFGASTAQFGGSRLWIIDKGLTNGGLYAGGTSAANVYNPAGTSAATSGFTLQPALMYNPGPSFGNGGSAVGTWLTAYNGTSNAGVESVMVIRVDDPLTTPVFTVQTVSVGDIDDTANSAYPATPGPLALPGVPQFGTTTLLDFSDRRMMSTVWRNNQLYAVTQVLPGSGPDTNQVTAHWFRIDTSNPNQVTLADQGNIGGEDIGSNVHTSYGALAVDPAGNMAIGFSATGAGMFAGSYYTVRAPSDAAGTVRKPQVIAAGQDFYRFNASPSRWGDYSGMALDPADDVTFWAYNQYALPKATATLGRYGSRWGAFNLAEPATPPPGTNPPAFITGLKWNDLDKDGVKDSNEVGVGGFTMYVDVNGNDRLDLGEPAANTDAIGQYTIESTYFGTYGIREVDKSGWVQTFPGSSAGFEQTVTLVSGQTVSNVNFGNNGVTFDFGDAPAPYPTLLASDGARAGFKAGFHLGLPTINVAAGSTLGVNTDTEADATQDANAEGDDLNGTDDEDGVTFPASGLVAGANATLQITVSNAGGPNGAVQGWIDFNGDGDWTDAGEQVIKDLVVAQGVHNVTIAVPATATSQTTFARFRYGYERGIGPKGPALVGEVEDYAVQIISDSPLANDDAAAVSQNSSNNSINVMANDFASSAGGLRIQSVGTPNRGGTVVISNGGTPTNFTDDRILYSPLTGFVGTETFTYVVTDASGKTDSATVTVTVASLSTSPVAVDDSFTFATATAAQLSVLANDTTGDRPPITITAVTQPASGTGSVTIIGGGTQIQYSPPSASFVGDVQFTYTIADTQTPANRTSTARVTLHVGDTTADDDVAVILRPYDLAGNPITVINPGQEFELVAFVQDLRTDDTVGNPTDNLGVYAAYFDLLYESGLVSLSGPVDFNGVQGSSSQGPWNAGQNADTNTLGIINETGAFQGSSQVFTSDEIEVFRVRMRANAVGQADFAADPADVTPLRDILVFQPPSAVPLSQISYGTASLFIGDPAAVLFRAVDDTATINANSGNVFVGSTTMFVMNNDLRGLNTPVTITSVTPLGSFQGSVSRNNSNTSVLYTAPGSGFVGEQQFQYTLTDTTGATSTAIVTMKVGATSVLNANDDVQIRLQATDASGNPISSATVGQTFQIRAFVSDLRADDGDGNASTDNRGVYAAYMDVLYSYQNAEFVSVTHNTVDYNNGKKSDGQVPGIVNEVGAFQTSSSALGNDEVLLFTVNLRATTAGTLTYQGDPSDVLPLNAVTLFTPPTNVTFDRIRLNSGTVNITAGAGGEAEFTNPDNNMDVNGDGVVSPLDVLLVINDMNSYGSRPLTAGEGEASNAGHIFLDVNADLHVSPIDALLIITHLNESGGEGESAAVDAPVALLDETDPLDGVIETFAADSGESVASASASAIDVYVMPVTGDDSTVSADDEDEDSLDSLIDALADDVAAGWTLV